jgi:hypothetical protein
MDPIKSQDDSFKTKRQWHAISNKVILSVVPPFIKDGAVDLRNARNG